MKSFWLGLAGSFVGIMLLGGIAFYADIFTLDKDGVPKFRVSDAGKITIGATESYINLVIQNNSGEPNNKVDITADLLVVENVRLENVSVSATITTTGAGGLDTGSEAASTWYYVWAITNNDGSFSSGLISVSSTSPSLPSGYTKKRRVGAVRNKASGDFLRFIQEGNRCGYTDAVGQDILTAGTATSFTTLGCSSFIPPTSGRGIIKHALALSSPSTTIFESSLRKTGSGAAGQVQYQLRTTVVNLLTFGSQVVDVDLNTSQQLDYVVDDPPAAGGIYLTVYGYYDRI